MPSALKAKKPDQVDRYRYLMSCMYPCCVAIRSLALPGEYGTWYFDLDVVKCIDIRISSGDTWIGVDRQGYGFFDLDVSGQDDSEFFPSFGWSKRINSRLVKLSHCLTIYTKCFKS